MLFSSSRSHEHLNFYHPLKKALKDQDQTHTSFWTHNKQLHTVFSKHFLLFRSISITRLSGDSQKSTQVLYSPPDNLKLCKVNRNNYCSESAELHVCLAPVSKLAQGKSFGKIRNTTFIAFFYLAFQKNWTQVSLQAVLPKSSPKHYYKFLCYCAFKVYGRSSLVWNQKNAAPPPHPSITPDLT